MKTEKYDLIHKEISVKRKMNKNIINFSQPRYKLKMTTVKLNTKDGEFEMSEELARMAPLLRDTIDESGTDELIPVETLSKEVIALVV